VGIKVTTIIGARPQFIKASMVSKALREVGVEESIVHTGQHFDDNMSDVFFRELGMPKPKHNLGIGGGSHGQNTGRMIESIEAVLLREKPNVVLVYGDTDSTLAGAIASVKLHIPVAHVEAGLRSFNRLMPEEINRVLTDHASEILFAPTRLAVLNLRKEGIPQGKIKHVGDVMYDAAIFYADIAEKRSNVLNRLNIDTGRYVLATVHRAENTDNKENLAKIVRILSQLSQKTPVIFPVHPRTKAAINKYGLNEYMEHIISIDPVGYLDMIMLEKHAKYIITDSGGVQKEAYFFRVPCVTLREETEWVELVEIGWNTLIPPKDATIEAIVNSAKLPGDFDVEKPFGDGSASVQIARIIGGISDK